MITLDRPLLSGLDGGFEYTTLDTTVQSADMLFQGRIPVLSVSGVDIQVPSGSLLFSGNTPTTTQSLVLPPLVRIIKLSIQL